MKLGRYLRSIILDEVGKRGQEILLNSKVGVIGVGGLGCPIRFAKAGYFYRK